MKPSSSSLFLFSLGVTAALLSNASAVDGTWANPTAITHTLTYVSSGVYSSSATLAVGDEIRTSANAAGLTNNRIYYIVAVNGSNYTLSTTPGGAAMSSTSTAGTTVASQGVVSWNATATNNLQTGVSWTGGVVPDGTDAIATIGNNIASPMAINSNITLGKISYTSTNNELNLFSSNNGGTSLSAITFSTSTGTPSIDVTGTKLFRMGLSDATFGQGKLKVSGTQGLVLNVTNSTGGGSIRLEDIDWSGFTNGGGGRGTLTIQQGAVQNTVNNGLGSGTSALNMVIGNGSTNGSLYLPEFQLGNAQNVTLNNLDGTSNGRITGASRTLTIGAGNGSNTDFAGIIGQSSTGANSNLSLSKTGTGTQTISGTIVGTGATVSVSGGTLVLSGNNSYTGATTVTGATLKIGHANALGTTDAGTTLSGTATLDLNGTTTAEALTINNAGNKISNTSGTAASLTADATVNADLTIDATGNITTARLIAGVIRNVTKLGNGTLTTSGTSHNNLTSWDIQAGTVVFANTSGYGSDRGTTLNGGTLRLSGSNSNLINDSQSFTINSGTFDLNGKAEATAAIGGNGGTITNSAIGSTSTLYVGGGPGGSSTASYGGVIENGAGTMKLTKEGTGTQTLSGTNTYSGATTISAGTLALASTGSIDNTSGVSLGTGGSFDVSAKTGGYTVSNLSGSGNVIGSLTVSTQLAIGNSPGTTSFDNLTLGGASTYVYELTGGGITADLGLVEGNLTLGSGALLDLVQLGTYTANDKFTLFSYTGILSGTFSGLADGATFTDAGGIWKIDYNDTSAGLNGGTLSGASYVTVTAVPEPRAALLGGLGLLALLRRRK